MFVRLCTFCHIYNFYELQSALQFISFFVIETSVRVSKNLYFRYPMENRKIGK
jgi:hypothetical protein